MQNDDTTDSIVPVTHAAYAHVDSTEASRTLEAVASQAAKELGAVLAIGDALTASDLPIIRRRLDEVIQGTNAAIQACEQQQLAQDETAQEAFQLVSNDQLKRLLRDAERLNFWQAHDWYTGERTADGVWRFFHAEDAEGQCCTGASLREALDEFQRTQPDLRGAMDDADAWEG